MGEERDPCSEADELLLCGLLAGHGFRSGSPTAHVQAGRSPDRAGRAAARLAGEEVLLSVTAGLAPGRAGEMLVELEVRQDAVLRVAAASAAGQVTLAAIPAGR